MPKGLITHSLNGPKTAKLTFKVRLLNIVIQPGEEESLERIATDLRITLRIIWERYSANQERKREKKVGTKY